MFAPIIVSSIAAALISKYQADREYARQEAAYLQHRAAQRPGDPDYVPETAEEIALIFLEQQIGREAIDENPSLTRPRDIVSLSDNGTSNQLSYAARNHGRTCVCREVFDQNCPVNTSEEAKSDLEYKDIERI